MDAKGLLLPGTIMSTVLYVSMTLKGEASSTLISLGGTELPASRRIVDLQGFQACRHQYSASAGITVRIEYSDDWGSTWSTLVDEYSMNGMNPRVSGWQVIPNEAKEQEVILRAYAVGSGLLTTVDFVEFQFR